MGRSGTAPPAPAPPGAGIRARNPAPPDARAPQPATANASCREYSRSPQQLPDLLDDLLGVRPRDRLARNQYGLPAFPDARKKLPPGLPEKPPSPIAGHRPADLPPRDPGRSWRAGSSCEVHYHPLRAGRGAPSQDSLDIARSAQLKRRVSCDPSPFVWQGSSALHGCASSGGTRGFSFVVACSVERFASYQSGVAVTGARWNSSDYMDPFHRRSKQHRSVPLDELARLPHCFAGERPSIIRIRASPGPPPGGPNHFPR